MRYLRYILLIIAIYAVNTIDAKDKIKTGDIYIAPLQTQVVGDSLELKLIIELPRKRVNLCTSLIFTPVITYENVRNVLPELVVAGRNNYALIKRNPLFNSYDERDEKLLMNYNAKEYKTYKGARKREGIKLIYIEKIKYADWLKNAKIEIYQSEMKCNKEIETKLVYTGEKIKINHIKK